MEKNSKFGIKKLLKLIGLYILGVIVGTLLQALDIFHVGTNTPDYIFPTLIFVPPVAFLMFTSMKKKIGLFILFSVVLMAGFSSSYKGVSFYESKPKIDINKYMGRYVFDNNIDTKGELIIMSSGSFSCQVTDYYGGELNYMSGKLDGKKLLFDGNNSDVKMSGTMSGDKIKIHLWTSIHGDIYSTYYKTDQY